MYQIVTGMTSDIGVLSTYLVYSYFDMKTLNNYCNVLMISTLEYVSMS